MSPELDHPKDQRHTPAPIQNTHPPQAVVITCSDSVSHGEATDRSGPIIAAQLSQSGFKPEAVVVPDERERISAAIRTAVTGGARVVVCTGGTGLGPRDVTPEALGDVLEREIPGLGEAFRAASRDKVPMTDLSRATAGTVDQSLVLALPGSVGGATDGMAVVGPLIQHALDMIDGGSHGRPHGGSHDGHPESGRTSSRHEHVGPDQGGEVSFSDRVGFIGKDGFTDRDPQAETSGAQATGSAEIVFADVSENPIDMAKLTELVADDAAGAIVSFEGRVRNHDHNRDVESLRYEGHPSAQDLLLAVLTEAANRPGLVKIASAHRIGDLKVGDLAFAVAVSSPHRREAFEAATWLVDEVKDRLPVWKKQVFVDGESEWVNCA